MHEGGVRVPFFIRWPGKIKPGITVKEIAAHIDVLPTLVDLCGLKKPRGLPLDGISIAPLLLGKATEWSDRMIFTPRSRQGKPGMAPGAVRTQRYRLILQPKQVELYDMEKDPGQKKDIAIQHPELVKKFHRAYEQWFKEAIQGYRGRPVIQVGHPQRTTVVLPAHEAYLNGNVKYKGRQGWANDWITNWTAPEDTISWDVKAVRPGRYQITLLYTCPKGETGSSIQVTRGDAVLKGKVNAAHNPKPIPSPDRVPRGEVYEKVWGELNLGVMPFSKGREKLTLQAGSKTGKQVMDIKGIRLQRLDEK